eukprot:CAMPEP_0178952978 /NCGR_PEP_ID=MMETSP0789-20121207/8158_1 /TAXON_ID=3005 /ORGANISM="Rhizosolenia setigera, Strain CCMP 1694" /LENGTH=247 /DNA_ID=CAMNT_0020634175 /DNA_START=201 /DNA_END=944 /DNA_ORIENTATION=-
MTHDDSLLGITVDPKEEEAELCIFILASPGSGSSTMVDLLQNCMPGCMISGENWAAFQFLDRFHQSVVRTQNQPRGDDLHYSTAWKMHFDLQDVEESINNLVRTMINPDGKQCWGFKEIRYGRGDIGGDEESNLSNDVEFLSSFCQNPKIIFHTKREPEDEFTSDVMRGRPELWNITRLQHQEFDSYVAKDKTSGEPPKVFRHYLEDYLERNTRFKELWEEYLECSSDMPEETIKLGSTIDKSHVRD